MIARNPVAPLHALRIVLVKPGASDQVKKAPRRAAAKERRPGRAPMCKPRAHYLTATGATVDPVAPCIFIGCMTKANS